MRCAACGMLLSGRVVVPLALADEEGMYSLLDNELMLRRPMGLEDGGIEAA